MDGGRLVKVKLMDVRVCLLLAWCLAVVDGQNVDFSFGPDAGSTANMTCDSDYLTCPGDAHTLARTYIRLTADMSQQLQPQMSSGWVFYSKPVQMKAPDNAQVASFSTVFTFRLNHSGADGLSFFMFANKSWRGAHGNSMGVYDSNGTKGTDSFAIEYDTYLNPNIDFSDNHVGVNAETFYSVKYRNASDVGIQLSSGMPITSWIDYDYSSTTLEVRISEDASSRPSSPFITYSLNLSTLIDENMHVGLSGATGSYFQEEDVLSWSFSSFGLPNSSSPAAPAPNPNSSSPTAAAPSLNYSTLLAPASSPGKHSRFSAGGVFGGVSVGVALLLCCLGAGAFELRRVLKRRKADLFLDTDSSHPVELPMVPVDMPFKFTYKELSVATNGFSEGSKLGEGGSSSVYHGVIVSTGQSVAVKKVGDTKMQGETNFLAEISVVSRLRHRHLVKLLGWCADRGYFLLVYELMPNGSLDKLLFRPEDDKILNWEQRLRIVKGVVDALIYLHEGFTQQVIHRDIKSSNVMLDKEFNAIVGDFGLARLMDHSTRMQRTQLAGTIGYIAPETAISGEFSAKTDVYSFGKLVLEVACGQPAVFTDLEGKTLVDWVWNRRAEEAILEVADPRLGGNFPDNEMENLLLLGLLCSLPDSEARPSMKEVGLILAGRVPLPSVPFTKPSLSHFIDQGVIWSKPNQTSWSGSSSTLKWPFSSSSSTQFPSSTISSTS